MLAQLGAFALPALLPGYIERWALSKTEAGWLVGIFFAAYVVMVPVLVSLTDRVPARRVYILGTGLTAASHIGFALLADGFWSAFLFRAMAGVGWAGTYMPGLKAVADALEGTAQSRAVSWHAAGVGISGAVSFSIAGLVGSWASPNAAFLLGGSTALVAVMVAFVVMPSALSKPVAIEAARRLLDFRPVLRNRAATSWIVGYTVHTLEFAALRAWGVTFLTSIIVSKGAPGWLPDPTVLFTLAGIVGIVVSITGNETAQRWGRARVVTAAMTAAALLSLTTVGAAAFRRRSQRCWSSSGMARFISTVRRLRPARCKPRTRNCGGRLWGCTACVVTPAAVSGRLEWGSCSISSVMAALSVGGSGSVTSHSSPWSVLRCSGGSGAAHRLPRSQPQIRIVVRHLLITAPSLPRR
jgi:MFS family permease